MIYYLEMSDGIWKKDLEKFSLIEEKIFNNENKKIILDFKETRAIDYFGLKALFLLKLKSKKEGIEIVFSNLRDYIREILKINGLE